MSANPSHFQPKVSVHTDVPLINSDRRPVESITYLKQLDLPMLSATAQVESMLR